jgi:quercetin dioxygenase-like cupin family protein
MGERSEPRTHPSDETGGSPQRPPRQVAAAVLSFDLAAELQSLRQEPSWRDGSRNARTLVKEGELRVVLTAMKAGSRLREHRSSGAVSVQTLEGRLRLEISGQVVELPAGCLLALEPDVPHDVEALEESAFLLTVAWPAGAGADS